MIELLLSAIDRLIDLQKIQEKRLKARYEEIYKPSFSDAERVHTDYLTMFNDTRSLISSGVEGVEGIQAAINLLAERRIAQRAVRIKLLDFKRMLAESTDVYAPQERDFLSCLAYYFDTTASFPSNAWYSRKANTISSLLIERLEMALKLAEKSPSSSNQDNDEVDPPDAIATTLISSSDRSQLSDMELHSRNWLTPDDVSFTCELAISDLEDRWQVTVAKFNDLRLTVAQTTS